MVSDGSPSSAPPPRLASRADCEGLRAWWQAGADLRQPGYDGCSALHVVSATSALWGHLLQEGLPDSSIGSPFPNAQLLLSG